MCGQRRFRSICASAKSDQSLSFPSKETLDLWLPIKRSSKTLIRLRTCAGWSESSMVAHANLYILLDPGSVTSYRWSCLTVIHWSIIIKSRHGEDTIHVLRTTDVLICLPGRLISAVFLCGLKSKMAIYTKYRGSTFWSLCSWACWSKYCLVTHICTLRVCFLVTRRFIVSS